MTQIVELRRYTLHPGGRDVLIDLFDREFVETQEAVGMRVLGQFRDLDDPDQFVWMRAFPDMAARAEALAAFYSGPAWKAHGPAANATMIAFDNVLLLRPVGRADGFDLDSAVRDTPASSLVVATIWRLDAPPEEEFVRFVDGAVMPLLKETGAAPLALLRTEYAENSFPVLPVRAGEHVLVSITSFADRAAYAEHTDELAHRPVWTDTVAPRLPVPERLLLAPTDRSMLR